MIKQDLLEPLSRLMPHLEKSSWIATIVGTVVGVIGVLWAVWTYFHPLAAPPAPRTDVGSGKAGTLAEGGHLPGPLPSVALPTTEGLPRHSPSAASPIQSEGSVTPSPAEPVIAARRMPSIEITAGAAAAPEQPPSLRERYVHASALVPGVKAVAFRGDPLIARELLVHLPHPVSIELFKPAFFSEGLFEQALLGDTTKIRSLSLGDSVDVVYLVQIAPARSVVQRELEGLVLTQVELRVVSIDPRTGAVLKSAGGTLEGRGFSPQQAFADVRGDIERKAASLLFR